ncbi:MAG TPA: hypothetical protein VE439_00415, partial [Anaerolineae bacterium]|nr:hypothetical protein [Anaerolineae bacterium]
PLHADFIYAETDKEDYLIPLFAGLKSMPLEQKKVYPAADILTAIARAEQRGAGGCIQKQSAPNAGIISMAVALIAILASVGVVLARRKSHLSDI